MISKVNVLPIPVEEISNAFSLFSRFPTVFEVVC
jgi:hypothetical protein